MVTETDVVQQVAEAKCQCLYPCSLSDHEDICSCVGTRRRWPTLSRECPGWFKQHDKCDGFDGTINEDYCNGSGRILEVTLEKVLDCLESEGYPNADFGIANLAMQAEGDMYQVDAVLPKAPWTCRSGKGPTRLLAACAALMAL